MYKVLVVDDEIKIRELIKKYITFDGNEFYEAGSGIEALEICDQMDFDIIIMDAMMPELDGFSTIREIRKTSNVPILMLSARGEEYDKIHGFELGVDDYVIKPFSPRELIMRMEAILKRAKKPVDTVHEVYQTDDLTVDFTARRVSTKNTKVDLSPKEYDLLFYMVENRGIALTRENLITNVWGFDFDGDERTLDTHIKQLRKNLGEYANLIVTLRGVGYRFDGK